MILRHDERTKSDSFEETIIDVETIGEFNKREWRHPFPMTFF